LDKDHVLVTGGYYSRYLTTSEIYTISTGRWSWGPSLPVATSYAKLMTVEGVTYHIGGYKTQNYIYRLDKNSGYGQWNRIVTDLKPKYDFNVVPIKFSPKNCNGWLKV